jgi:hypothetical protein
MQSSNSGCASGVEGPGPKMTDFQGASMSAAPSFARTTRQGTCEAELTKAATLCVNES